ncbi:MAG: isocitrate lyase/phosphoenolpyruvate mutase family protein, partial [Stackebrandtia sp.]
MALSPKDQLTRAQQFRRLHVGPGPFVMPNPWDGATARILTTLGFKALATTSAGVAFAHGQPDGAGRLTLHDMLGNAHTILGSTTLPLAADLENLYAADSEEIAANIAKAAESGLVGASIEDASPDVPGGIYPIDEATERVAAAVAAKNALSFPFTLTARAENFLRGRDDLD